MTTLVTIYGSFGLSLLLIAFVLNLIGKLRKESIFYNLLNAVGGITLAHYAFLINATVFLVLEGIWGLFGIYGLINQFLKSKK